MAITQVAKLDVLTQMLQRRTLLTLSMAKHVLLKRNLLKHSLSEVDANGS